MPGEAAQAAYKAKVSNYTKRFQILPVGSFVPLVVETGGRMHPLSRKLLEHVVADMIGGDCKQWTPAQRALPRLGL